MSFGCTQCCASLNDDAADRIAVLLFDSIKYMYNRMIHIDIPHGTLTLMY